MRLTNGLDEQGTVNWDLALCLLLGWIICYLCVWKGVKSTGRVSRTAELLLGTFRSEDEDDYDEFSVLSMRIWKNVGLQAGKLVLVVVVGFLI